MYLKTSFGIIQILNDILCSEKNSLNCHWSLYLRRRKLHYSHEIVIGRWRSAYRGGSSVLGSPLDILVLRPSSNQLENHAHWANNHKFALFLFKYILSSNLQLWYFTRILITYKLFLFTNIFLFLIKNVG